MTSAHRCLVPQYPQIDQSAWFRGEVRYALLGIGLKGCRASELFCNKTVRATWGGKALVDVV
jgi:hypothetical protein